MPEHDIIVIGASAGGVETLIQLVKSIPANIPAAIFIVVHISPHSVSLLPKILQRRTSMPVSHGKDGEEIKLGHIYIAPPDFHLLIKPEYVRLTHGPKENRHRPAVDPLFRSAAQGYKSRVIGVILSGTLDDGTAGLFAIKEQGGIAIVQDPEEAIYDGMPRSAIENVAVDYILSIAQIGAELVRLAHEPTPIENHPVDPQLKMETDIAELAENAVESQERPGKESPYSCPECGGVLWELNNENFLRFRCRTGHAIKDSGIGIPAEEQANIFEWFYRASNIGNVEGIGLGLSVVKQCVHLHKGKIAIESEVGVGTTVTVTLPMYHLRS